MYRNALVFSALVVFASGCSAGSDEIANLKANVNTLTVEKTTLWSELDEHQKAIDDLRWAMDDLLIKTRDGDLKDKAEKLGGDNPESVVEVSKDYPKWRLPYGVKINDQRPPEMVKAAIEEMKAGKKRTVYMWLAVDGSTPERETRIYMTDVKYDPNKAKKP